MLRKMAQIPISAMSDSEETAKNSLVNPYNEYMDITLITMFTDDEICFGLKRLGCI